jgi:hypothetical protein
MTAVMGWLGKSRQRPLPAGDGRQLVQPKGVLVIGLVGFVFFAALAILSNVFTNETTTWWTTAVFVGFALLSASLVSVCFTDRHELSDSELIYTTFFGARKHMRWSTVKTVRYAPVAKWFWLKDESGQVARISAMLMGLPEFARLLLKYVSPQAIDEETRKILQACAEGRLPPLYS